MPAGPNTDNGNPSRQDVLDALIRPLGTARYGCDYPFNDLEEALRRYERDFGLNLMPDFQRGHVWSQEQQQHYIENIMRGVIPQGTLLIQFNAPHWDESDYEGDLPREMQIIDGLQRLTAIRKFLAGEVRPFGLGLEDLSGTRYAVTRTVWHVRFAVHTFQSRAELISHYLALNAGGTPHSTSEIERVRNLLAEASHG